MNKAELIDAIAGSAKLSKADAKKALEGFIEVTTKALKKDDRVALVGFGSFSTSKRAARKGRNPQTGKEETHGTGTWRFHLFIKDKVLAEKHKNMRAKGSTLGELYLQVAFYAGLITKDWDKALAKNSENALSNMETKKQNEILKDTGQLVPIPPRPYEEEYQLWLQVKMLERELDGWD